MQVVSKRLYLLDLLWSVGGLGTHIIGIAFSFMEAKYIKLPQPLCVYSFGLLMAFAREENHLRFGVLLSRGCFTS